MTFIPNGRFVAANRLEPIEAFGFTHCELEQLKREIGFAVWNWEKRRGLPHYGGPNFFRESITQDRLIGMARRYAALKEEAK